MRGAVAQYNRNRPFVVGAAGTRVIRQAAKYAGKKIKSYFNQRGAKSSSRKLRRSGGRRKLKNVRVPGTGGGLTFFSMKRRGKRFLNGLFKYAATNVLLTTNSSRMSSSVGKQGVATISEVFSNGDMAGNIFPTGSGFKTQKYMLRSCQVRSRFTNQDMGNVELQLYDIVARRDVANSNINQPSTAWAQGIADSVGSGLSTSDVNDANTYPFDSQLFVRYFKVLKVTRMVLGQGQSHTHISTIKPNQMLSGEIEANSYNIKGLTYYCMAVVSGMPYNDSITKTQVSLGNSVVDWVSTKRYEYSYMQDIATNYTYVSNLPTSFTVQESVMDVGSGAASAETQA